MTAEPKKEEKKSAPVQKGKDVKKTEAPKKEAPK